MKLPRRRLELDFINIPALSWLCYENSIKSCCSRGQRDLIQHIMKSFCSSFFLDIFLFFFFCVAAKSPTFYTDIRILVLHINHNHVICIPCAPPPSHTQTPHLPCLLQAQKVTALFFCTVRKTNAQSFQASLHLCANYKRALIGWSGGVKMLGKLSVPTVLLIWTIVRAKTCCACSRCG